MNLAINFFSTELSKKLIKVNCLSFKDNYQFDKLTIDHPASYFVRSRDKILFWGKDAPVAEEITMIDIDKDSNLISNVLACTLLKQFTKSAIDIVISKYQHVYRITFYDTDISKNRYQGLKLYKSFHLHFTPLNIDSYPSIGFTISSSIAVRISWTVQDFEKKNIPFDDLNYDRETGEVFATTKAIYRLAQYFKYSSQLKDELDRQNAVQNEFQNINYFVETYFASQLASFSLPDDTYLNALTGTVYDLGTPSKKVKISTLSTPECYFYNGTYPKNQNSFHKRKRIGYYKPFTYDEFENKTINISIIFTVTDYEDVGNFFVHVQRELIDTFKLKKDSFKYTSYKLDNSSLKSYQSILSSIKDADLVIVVVDEAHEILQPHESPYYFCKAEFIKRGVNTQEVQIQQVRQFLSDKKQQKANYTDHNIALNIYAKLGGMAWTIKPNYRRNELIIGIGATTDKNGQPILGLTSIFSGDGKYILGKASSVANMDDYRDKLEQVITASIEECIQDGTLDTRKVFYLIFHIFKPAGKNNEVKALEKAISKFPNYSFEHAFVHIGNGHNYRFFTYSEGNTGPQFELKRNLGQNPRGLFVEVNRKMGFLGLRSSSSVFLKIDIHKSSSFVDLEYIAEQIYQFAEMSHTSYNIQGNPITIKYPQLMASFMEKFQEGKLIYLDTISMPDYSLWFI